MYQENLPGSGDNMLVIGLKHGIGDLEQIDLFMCRCRRNYPVTAFLTAGYVLAENIITEAMHVIDEKQKGLKVLICKKELLVYVAGVSSPNERPPILPTFGCQK